MHKHGSDAKMHSTNQLQDLGKIKEDAGSDSFTSEVNSESAYDAPGNEDTPFLFGAFGIQIDKTN